MLQDYEAFSVAASLVLESRPQAVVLALAFSDGSLLHEAAAHDINRSFPSQ